MNRNKLYYCLTIIISVFFSNQIVYGNEIIENSELNSELIENMDGQIEEVSEVYPSDTETVIDIPDDIINIDPSKSRTIFGNDNRQYVSNTKIYPYSAVTQLVMKFSDGYYVGTGNIINDNYVLTAAHNLYNPNRKEWASSIQVIPGAYPKGSQSIGTYFKTTYAKNKIIPSDWAKFGREKDDIALIELQDNIGKSTGSFGLTTTVSKSVTLTGFPADKYTSQNQPRMTTETRNYDSLSNDFIKYKLDTYGGSSGSGVYSSNNHRIFGVHAYGLKSDYLPENSHYANQATRITDTWFNFVALNAKFYPPAKSTNKMVTIKSSNYTLWKNFVNWNKKSDTSNKKGNTYKVKYEYDHFNGDTYYSLYDSNDNWQGYINKTGVQELKAEAFNKSVSIRSENYNIWKNFFWEKKSDTKGKLGKVYKAKYKYKHFNGDTYYSLYDSNDNWQGYINSSGTVELNPVSYNKKVTITKSTYNIWGNFFFNNKKGHTSNHVGKTYNAKYIYTLGDGVKYYSLYNGDTWLGYLNTGATQVARNLTEENDDDKYDNSINTTDSPDEEGNIDPIESTKENTLTSISSNEEENIDPLKDIEINNLESSSDLPVISSSN